MLKKIQSPINTGAYCDLKQILHQLNEKYFDNLIDATINWGKTKAIKKKSKKSIILGSYNPNNKKITIHPNLDQAFVPRLCVQRIVYHEMLHQKCPSIRQEGKKNQIHTAQFKNEEKKFKNIVLADNWFKENLHRLLR